MDAGIFNLGIPVLGICYGMHFMVDTLGGKVKQANKREYGFAALTAKQQKGLFAGIGKETVTWMSHGDSIQTLPKGFTISASTTNTKWPPWPVSEKKFFGVQFHPEVEHTAKGRKIIRNFLFDICGCKPSWTMKSFARDTVDQIRETVGDKKVILGLSGGVDSSVTALLIHRAIGNNLTCIFVDNGLLRKNEADQLKQKLKSHLKINIRFVKAATRFVKALYNVSDPERKRKIIGKEFMDVFEAEALKIKDADFLAKGPFIRISLNPSRPSGVHLG